MRAARGPAGGVLAALGLLLLAGCGGEPAAPAATAATATAAAVPSGASVPLPADPEAARFVERVTAAARAAGTAQLSVLSGEPGAEVVVGTGVVRFGEHGTDLHVRFPQAGSDRYGDIETIAVGGAEYMGTGMLAPGLFVEAGPSTHESVVGMLMGGIAAHDVDPLRELTTTPEAVLGVVPVGAPEQVDGVPAQAYDVTVDQRPRLREAHAADPGVDLALLDAELEALDPEEYEVVRRYWVDESGLLRKVSAATLLGGPTEIRLSAWGTDVEITAPAPDRVLDSDDLSPQQLPADG